VSGFYRPPVRVQSGGTVSGEDPEGDSGLVIAPSASKLQVDGNTRLDARLDSVKIVSGGVFQVESPIGVSFTVDSSGRTTFSLPVKTATAASSPVMVSTADAVVLVDSTDGPVTVRLPDAGSIGDGRVFAVKNTASGATNAVTIEAINSQLDGAATVLADDDFSAAIVVSGNGAYWIV